jgi:hypothetical protein
VKTKNKVIMLAIQSRLLITTLIMINAFLSSLGALQVKAEFYPAQHIPQEYKEFSDGSDCTAITLKEWPIDSLISILETRLFQSKETNEKGLLKPEEGLDPVHLVSALGYTPGFPVTFTFKDSRKGLKEEITIIPNRIYVSSPIDHAQIEAKLIQRSPANYSLVFEGFGEGEELLFRSCSYQEQIEQKLQFNKGFSFSVMPGVINKQGGIARLSFIRQSGEILKLELPWGLEWLKYLLFYDKDQAIRSLIDVPEFRKQNPKIAEYFDAKR